MATKRQVLMEAEAVGRRDFQKDLITLRPKKGGESRTVSFISLRMGETCLAQGSSATPIRIEWKWKRDTSTSTPFVLTCPATNQAAIRDHPAAAMAIVLVRDAFRVR